jgi:serine/threonine-protein kinase
VETLTKQLKEKLPYNAAIPWQVMKVLRKATEKEPSKRYQSADEMKVALRNAVSAGLTFVDKIRKFLPFLNY